MNLYDMLNKLDNDDNEIGVSPLSYVSLGCAR